MSTSDTPLTSAELEEQRRLKAEEEKLALAALHEQQKLAAEADESRRALAFFRQLQQLTSGLPPLPLSSPHGRVFGDPYFLHPSESPGLIVSVVILKSNNYREWATAIESAFDAKNKFGFVDGTIPCPPLGHPDHTTWFLVNSMLVNWMMNTVDSTIRKSVPFVKNVKKLWDTLKARFSIDNGSRIFQLQDDINGCRQNGQSVAEYYSKLAPLIDEFQALNPAIVCTCAACKPLCTCDYESKIFAARDRSTIFQFLLGLDPSYHHLRNGIIARSPLDSMDNVYNLVVQEEITQSLVRSRDHATESLALAARRPGAPPATAVSDGRPRRSICDYCHVKGHDKESCFKLIGYPEWYPRPKSGAKSSGAKSAAAPGTNPSTNRRLPPGTPFVASATNAPLALPPPPGFAATAGPTVDWSSIDHLLTDEQRVTAQRLFNNLNSSSGNMSGKLHLPWILDSGASYHMTGVRDALTNLTLMRSSVNVLLPDGSVSSAFYSGSLRFGDILLHNVLHIPELRCNLLSCSRLLASLHCLALLTENFCILQTISSRTVIGVGEQYGGVYWLRNLVEDFRPHNRLQPPTRVVSAVQSSSSSLWHQRFGHPSSSVLSSIPSLHYSHNKTVPCSICHRAKQARISFPVSLSHANNFFDLVHCDVWGPYKTSSSNGSFYFFTIVDDYSRYIWVHLLVHKSDVASKFKQFCALVRTQFSRRIRRVRADNGTEFLPLKNYFADEGIIFDTTIAYTPQQNGRAERKHRHLLNVARALMFQANLPIRFWGECIRTAAYLINRTPSPLLRNHSPFELLYGTPPTYSEFRVFGCLCFASVLPRPRDKFASRSRCCVFLGYTPGKKGFHLYDLESESFFDSRDVIFYEHIFPFAKDSSAAVSTAPLPVTSSANYDDFGLLSPLDALLNSPLGLGSAKPAVQSRQQPDPIPSTPVRSPPPQPSPVQPSPVLPSSVHPSPTQQPHASIPDPSPVQSSAPLTGREPSTRAKSSPAWMQDYVLTAYKPPSTASSALPSLSSGIQYPISDFVTYDNFSASHSRFLYAVTSSADPTTYRDASQHPHWQTAMSEEISALERNGTWTMTPLPPGKKAIGSKWVFRTKFKSDGSIERHKARLVVLGNRQIEGTDFTETFAPVAKMDSVRLFLTVAAIRGWELHQMDVHNAFLHGDLHEEVYMRPPPGYGSSPGLVCKLQKSLYGLRQAPRNWFKKLSTALVTFGFVQSKAEYSLFSYLRGSISMHVLLYVDDLVISSSSSTLLANLKEYLGSCFHMKDLGSLKYFLGIEVARGPDGIFLCQRKYALDILSDAGLSAGKPVDFPMEPQHDLARVNEPLFDDPARYRRLIGRLIYLTITRPELSYSVHTLAQFMQSPCLPHWQAALRVLHYLKSHPGQGLFLSARSSLQLTAFCDSDWATCPITRRSLTGYFIMLGHSPVSWKTKKQATVSRSSAEAEYRAMAYTCCQLLWVKSFLHSLGVHHTTPMRLFCDSQAALHIAANPVFHERTKHIEVDCHFVRDLVQSGSIVTSYISTKEQPADLFTKALGRAQFHVLLGKLGIRDLHAPT